MSYWLNIDDQSFGPYSLDEIVAMLEEGRVLPETMAAAEGSEDWVPLSRIIRIQPATPTLVTGGRMPAALSGGYQRPAVSVSQPRSGLMAFIIVIVLIALLVVVGLSLRNRFAKASREMATEARRELVVTDFRRLQFGLDAYLQREKQYPSKEEGLAVVMANSKAPVDPWGNPYQYEIDPGGTRPVLISWGPDGESGTPDDLRSDVK